MAWILAGAALAVGLVRFLRLGTWSLWLDEALTLADARHGESASYPIGYRLFGAFYDLAAVRPDEALLRLPAALCGWAVLPCMLVVLRPFAGARARALATLLVAVSGWHVYWSQNARFYTLAQLLALLGGAAVFSGLSRPSTGRLGAGALLLGAGALTHPSVALLVAGLVAAPWLLRLAGVLSPGPGERRVWILFALLGLGAVVAGSGWARSVWEVWDLKKGQGNPVHFVLTVGFYVPPPVGLGMLAGAWLAWRHRRPLAVPAAAVVVALAAGLLVSLFARMSAQYVFALLPWIALVAAGPVEHLSGRALRTAAYAAFLAVPLAVDGALYFASRHGDRPRWREAYEYVFERRGPFDLVLAMEAPVGEYYLDPRSDDLRDWKTVAWLDRYRARVHLFWLHAGRPIWLVVNEEQLEDWEAADADEMRRFLAEECSLEAEFPVPWTPRDLDLRVYRWRGA